MTERIAEFIVRVDGDNSSLLGALEKLKGAVRTATTDLERQTGQVELFKMTQAKVEATGAAFGKLTERAAEFRRQIAEIEGAGGKVGTELTAALKATEKQIAQTSREYNRQSDALAKLDADLRKAGVNVGNLAAEEQRLAAAIKAAEKAQAEQAARQLLGVKSAKETADQVARLRQAYDTLKASGAPLSELAQASRNLADRTAELQGSTGGLVERFAEARVAILAIGAAVAGTVAIMRDAIKANLEFEDSLAKIGTVTSLTEAQLGDLGKGVQGLAETLGFDVQDGLRAVYDLLRAGVPAGNVLEVLATADDAAKAGVISLGDAAKLAGVLIRGFGLDVSQVKPAIDALFVAAKNGGATLGEMAAGLGDLGPVARATRTPVQEVAAAIQVMTSAGLDAPTAIGQLTQIMTRLASPETVAQLKALGIESRGLIGTLQQIADRGLGVGEILQLGVSSTRAAAGIAALTNNAGALSKAMADVGNSSGALDQAAEALNRLKSEAIQRLVAALVNLKITLGEIVTPSTQTITSLTELVRVVNTLVTAAQAASTTQSGVGAAITTAANAAVLAVTPLAKWEAAISLAADATRFYTADVKASAQASTDAARAVGDAAAQIAQAEAAQMEAARVRVANLRAELTALIPELTAGAKVIQDVAAQTIASIDRQAQTQIAGLDKLRASEAANATELVAIQKRQATDRLAIIQKAAADAITAFNLEADARRAAAGKSAVELAKVEREIADSKRAILGQIVSQYEAHVAALVQLETGHLNKIKEIEEKRIDVNTSIEEKIREIRSGGLSAFEQYYDKVRQIDENVSKARRALAEGDLTSAEKFAQRAVELTSGISKQVEQDGRVVVGQFTAQETAVGKLKAAQEVLNGVLTERVKAEEAGAAANKANLETSRDRLKEVRGELEKINELTVQGIQVKVETTAAEAVKAAKAEIDSLNGRNTTSTHTVTVKTVEANAAGGMVGEKLAAIRRSWPAAREGVQHFARGGSVFRRPTWSKVPGAGNQDTVPAALPAGSFVIRKAASRYYGDDLLAAINGFRRFALGGPASALPSLGGRIEEIVASNPLLAALGSGAGREVEGVDYQELIRQLITIQEAARALPRSTNGLNVDDWVALLRARLPFMTDEKVRFIAQEIDQHFQSFLDGVVSAANFRVPFVVSQDLMAYLFSRGGGGPGLGRGTDTVPAMLTPGEWVINRRAVDRYGAGLMHAINSMRVSRESLAGMLRGPRAPQSPRYYADGGPVASAGASTSSETATSGGGRQVTININAAAGAILTPENVRRLIVPVLRDDERRRA